MYYRLVTTKAFVVDAFSSSKMPPVKKMHALVYSDLAH